MSKPRESAPQRTRGWTSDTEVVREFDRPVSMVDAVTSTVGTATETWSELSEDPPLFEFIDVENLDGLFRSEAARGGWPSSVEFEFQGCAVTILYGRTVRVVIERDPL